MSEPILLALLGGALIGLSASALLVLVGRARTLNLGLTGCSANGK